MKRDLKINKEFLEIYGTYAFEFVPGGKLVDEVDILLKMQLKYLEVYQFKSNCDPNLVLKWAN